MIELAIAAAAVLRQEDHRGHRAEPVDPGSAGAALRRGLDEEVVRAISGRKGEPRWMLELRLEGLRRFRAAPLPDWGPDLTGLDLGEIRWFASPADRPATEGVIFTDTDTALREHEDLVRRYFAAVVPVDDNPFAALNTAVWSGGSFVYVPPGVRVDIPLQAYYRLDAEHMGQFERTLIVVDDDAEVHFVEGCTAPVYATSSLNAAVAEVVVNIGGRCRCTTVQHWSPNVYNLVTKRALCATDASMEWVDGNLGSGVTMKYPSIVLAGARARGEVYSLAMAGPGQYQDTGARVIHAAPDTSSSVVAKSVVHGGGRAAYRGLVRVLGGAHRARASVRCDTLLLDAESRSDTHPHVDVRCAGVETGHEATVSRIGEDQLFYLMSRGIGRDEAMAMVVRGFLEPVARQLPMEYALELNRLIEVRLDGAVG